MRRLIYLLVLYLIPYQAHSWGFYAHKVINFHAVFLLPDPLFGFYKKHIDYLTDKSTSPDMRRYIVEGEAEKHYIDLDYYREKTDPDYSNWDTIRSKFSEEEIHLHGKLPWAILEVKNKLTSAMRNKNLALILKLSADLGHYIADANVPLHTTSNYDGQETNQVGIHAFWESRLPELFTKDYDFILPKSKYVQHPLKRIWNNILKANSQIKVLLEKEKKLSNEHKGISKFEYCQRGKSLKKEFSRYYSTKYHESLKNQVENQMRASIQMLADFIYTCWVDAGKPRLDSKEPISDLPEEEDLKSKRKINITRCTGH